MSTKQQDEDRARRALQGLRRRLLEAREREQKTMSVQSSVPSDMNITATRKFHQSLRAK